jgi:hypothetical protein
MHHHRVARCLTTQHRPPSTVTVRMQPVHRPPPTQVGQAAHRHQREWVGARRVPKETPRPGRPSVVCQHSGSPVPVAGRREMNTQSRYVGPLGTPSATDECALRPPRARRQGDAPLRRYQGSRLGYCCRPRLSQRSRQALLRIAMRDDSGVRAISPTSRPRASAKSALAVHDRL